METSIERYQNALDYLYSFIDYSLTKKFRYSPEKFDLLRMELLLQSIGNPHLKYPVVHVAGTKGKGSTSAMIVSILKKAGYTVGLYISPHLEDFCERIQVNRVNIPQDEMADLVDEIKPYVKNIDQLTTFELTTALGFLYFAKKNVDIAVIEVGMGGRLDATNMVDPLISVITSISYDHTHILGNTLTQIAFEKAGIIKPGRPVVMAPQNREARHVIEDIARKRNAPLTIVGKDVLYAPWVHSLEGQSFLFWNSDEQELVNRYINSGGMKDWEPLRINIPLLGYHQVENAATAYAVIEQLISTGYPIRLKEIIDGFANVEWPARFEILRKKPPVIIDGAQNQDSALKLRLAIDDYLPGYPVFLVFGASEDKDVGGMFKDLLPRVSKLIATESNHPRAMEAQKIIELAQPFGTPAEVITPFEDAFECALNQAGTDYAVVVAGSLFVAAAAREVWTNSTPR